MDGGSMQETIVDGAAALASHPLTVQVINKGTGIWGNVVSGAITAVAAIVAVMLTHRFTLKREKQASEDKLQRERYFIATELIFMLEQFAEGCARVASDHGEDNETVQPERKPAVNYPQINLTEVSGDWRVLPGMIMYRIRELPVLQNDAGRAISYASETSWAPYHTDFFQERQYQFARLGIKAVILSMRLRKSAGLPENRSHDSDWSAYNVLWKVWRRERKRRAAEYISNRPWHEPVVPNNKSEDASL